MRKLYNLVILVFFFTASAYGQTSSNAWIPFAAGQPYSTQQYFRVSVWKEGIYRLSFNDLQSAGVPVTTWFDPQRYQLFNKGLEQFIRVLDQNADNIFNPGDYIEFYGKANDGESDTQLYDTPSSQPNTFYSLFNDTAAYFLTYNLFSNSNRRMPVETDMNFNGYPLQQNYIYNDLQLFTNNYNIGNRDLNDIADNSYTRGEGFYSDPFPYSSPKDVIFNVNHFDAAGPQPHAQVVAMGRNANPHPYQVKGGGSILIDSIVFGYEMVTHDLPLNNLPGSGAYTVQFTPLPDPTMSVNENFWQLSYVQLSYPKTFDFTGETLPYKLTISNGSDKAYVELSNVSAADAQLYIVSGDTVKYITLDKSGTPVKGLVPVYGSSVKCYLLDASQIMNASGNVTISNINDDPDPNVTGRFINYLEAAANADYIMISNKLIWNAALDYKAYRATTNHTPFLADVDQLYDQFSWGIRKHPLSIRLFADFLLDNMSTPPQYLFLLGKSVISHDARNGVGYAKNLVPTYGEPASDQMFTSQLNTTEFKPEMATGRLAAQSDADVQLYLNKVMSFEAQQQLAPAEWMKKVLHFGGGSTASEQLDLSNNLKTYKDIIEDTLFGGTVQTFLKTSSAPIQINQSQYLQQQIDSGCSMMTFYGHAAGTSFDISTDDPENYNNKDRYPLVLAQSCFVGDIHSVNKLLNERFILTADKGAIGFIAVPDKGLIGPLHTYSVPLHRNLFQKMYGQSIAKCMQATVAEIIANDFDRKSVCMNMTLHGDPALVLNMYEEPDYVVEAGASITFEPSQVTTELDSFNVKIVVANLGKNTSQSIHILLSRTYPDGVTKKDTIFQVPYITYKDTFSIRLPVDFKIGSGLNDFHVQVDAYDEVDEREDFLNNNDYAQLIINSTDINPVFPFEYAIVPSDTVTLKATTANLFAAARTYAFEVDTTPFFNSFQKQTGTVDSAYGIVSWQIPALLVQDIVYYWRVANDSINNPDTSISNKFQWKESSFMYKPGITGWSQAQYFQFSKSTFANVFMQDTGRIFKFIKSQYSLALNHTGYNPSYEINGVLMDYGGCTGTPQIAIAVLDSIDFDHPWDADSCDRNYGNFNTYSCLTGVGCFRNHPDKYFLFNATDPVAMNNMKDLIENIIPDGNYVMGWNVWPVAFSSIAPSVKQAFVDLGVTGITALQDTEKFMFFVKKGDPSTLLFDHGPSPTAQLNLDYTLTRDWDKGYVKSTAVGPATSWTTLHWLYTSVEPSSSPDSISIQVIGITPTGQEVILKDSIKISGVDVDLSTISAVQYPYLKLKAFKQDVVNRTPPQLDRWQIYYEPVPEGALNTRYYSFYNDTVQEGDTIRLNMAFENISSVDMDTLLVDYFLYDNQNVKRNIGSVRLHRDLPAGDTIMTSISFSSQGYAGKNVLWIEANPHNDQPEQAHFNNLANLHFYVGSDKINPLLDVTFDGTHILNGDIVSARPNISIQLLDENKFIALNDTSNFRVSLKSPSGVLEYLHFENSSNTSTDPALLKWIPATLPKNSFRIEYSPVLLEDGIYEMDVQATDEAGNLSGLNDYRIQFEIINKSTITEVVNYPNPFSTSTRFVFILTGSEVPTDFRIQIMTVTGKIIREIMRDEIGNIHIGRNITEYAWDGKDEFGDQLANGVYIYRVITSMNGAGIEKRATEADKYFKKGWGKMYLLR